MADGQFELTRRHQFEPNKRLTLSIYDDGGPEAGQWDCVQCPVSPIIITTLITRQVSVGPSSVTLLLLTRN